MSSDENEELFEELNADVSKKFRTPQEKKALSLTNDRRNSYGESDKGSRLAIRRNKIKPTRAYRRKVEQLIQSQTKVSETHDLDLMESKVREIKRRKWKKSADMPLGEWIKYKLEYRRRTYRAKIKRRARRKED